MELSEEKELVERDWCAPISKQMQRPRLGAVIPHKWGLILRLHLAGKTVKEIAALVDMQEQTIYRILRRPQIEEQRRMLLTDIERDFEALYSRVVNNLREQLDSTDPQVQLAAQTQFFKATGKFQPKRSESEEKLTAEEVVSKLLAQQINVNVHVSRD